MTLTNVGAIEYREGMENFSHVNDLKSLGDRMLAARKTYPGTFKELAERTGLTTDAFLKYFRGEREIGAVSLACYASVCGLTPNALLLKVAPDSLDAAEFPRFPAAKRALVVRLLTAVHGIDGLMPASFESLKEDVEMHERLFAKMRAVCAENGAGELSMASEEPAAYGESEAGESLEARASEAIAAVIEELNDPTTPAAERLMAVQRDLIEKAGVPGNAGGLGRRGVGGESADGAEAAGVSAGASSLAAGPKHRQKRKPNK